LRDAARVCDLVEIFCVRIAEVLRLGNEDANVPVILNVIPSSCSRSFKSAYRKADGPISTPAPVRAKIHRHPDNRDFRHIVILSDLVVGLTDTSDITRSQHFGLKATSGNPSNVGCLSMSYGLGIQAVEHTGKGIVSRTFEAADPCDRALDAHTEAGVRTDEFTQVEIPLETSRGRSCSLMRCIKSCITRRALAAPIISP
jgi:hypothetical protein